MQTLDQCLTGARGQGRRQQGRGALQGRRTRTRLKRGTRRSHGSRSSHQADAGPAASVVTSSKARTCSSRRAFRRRSRSTARSRPQSDRGAHRRAVSHCWCGSIMNDRQTQGVRRHQGVQLRDRPAGHRALPRQRLRAAGAGRCASSALINAKIPTFEELELPPILQGSRAVQARPGDRGRRHRLGQVDHARGDGRLPQREDPRPHRHHRGPGRVRVTRIAAASSRTARWASTPSPGTRRSKNTLRQAPDVILIGEIRDRETMEYGIQFAETGHLVLATLHANSANQALDRIINFFPDERREQLLMDLSLNMRGADLAAPDSARERHAGASRPWRSC